ncbi:MAG: MazG nucleotide pyrophosphohydrolase domain-containing protein [Bacillota bacterium]
MKTPLTIKALQTHIKAVDHQPKKQYEVVLKLFEEVGELSEEMRKAHQEGLTKTNKQNIKYELYDVIHYVTHIANIYGIDLEEAIIEKDQINAKRYNDQRRVNHD